MASASGEHQPCPPVLLPTAHNDGLACCARRARRAQSGHTPRLRLAWKGASCLVGKELWPSGWRRVTRAPARHAPVAEKPQSEPFPCERISEHHVVPVQKDEGR